MGACRDWQFEIGSLRLVVYCRTTSASPAHALRIVLRRVVLLTVPRVGRSYRGYLGYKNRVVLLCSVLLTVPRVGRSYRYLGYKNRFVLLRIVLLLYPVSATLTGFIRATRTGVLRHYLVSVS